MTAELTYALPGELQELGAGDVVTIPLGPRVIQAVVIRKHRNKPEFAVKPVRSLIAEQAVTPQQLSLAGWLAEEYVSPLPAALRTVVPVKFGKTRRKAKEKGEVISLPESPLSLSEDQKRALTELRQSQFSLLWGTTGSGKTELYLQLTQEALKDGKSVIILVPEISLTPQQVERFEARFPARVAVWHSRLTEAQKWHTWQSVKDGSLPIVIGSRSALFAPIKDLGLIVIDEEHDHSYKQEQAPRYVSRDVARQIAEQTGAKLVLGSATPSLEAFYAAEQNDYSLVRLPERIRGKLPRIRVVDLRQELKKGNFSPLSEALQERLGESLHRGEQSLLFLNRRGTHQAVVCRSCGEVVRCPHCEIALTHHAPDLLLCHHCGFEQRAPQACPACGSELIRYLGIGTQKIASEIAHLFPEARVLRMDRDTTTAQDSHEQIYRAFSSGDADILIGTQMITKGWDIPAVTTIGVVLADLSLTLPDFRASEMTFQLLTQVAGRSGRGEGDAEVVIQTYNPDHPTIASVQRHDSEGFLRRELELRRRLHYPPFTRLIRLQTEDSDEAKARARAEAAAAALEERDKSLPDSEVLGPVPGFLRRLRGKYLYQIILKVPAGTAAAPILDEIDLRHWSIDVDPARLL
jgi:primosomal protein N' (replication factor Y)